MKYLVSLVLMLALLCPLPSEARRWVPKIAAAGSTLIKSEDFTGTNLADLTSLTGWVAQEGQIFLTDSVGSGFTGASNSATEVYYWGSASASLNQSAEYTIVQAGASSSYTGVAVRCQSGADSAYVLLVFDGGWTLQKKIAGTYTELTNSAVASAAGVKFKLLVAGSGASTRLTVYKDTGSGFSAVASDVDPGTYLGSGYAGISGFGNAGTHIGDDFKWYDN